MRLFLLLSLAALLSACAGVLGQPSIAAPAGSSLAASVPSLPAGEVRLMYRKNAALAQYYRWYLLHENDAATLANALDILDPDVTVKSGLGEGKGHAAYGERIAQLPKAWDNSHQVEEVIVTPYTDGTVSLVARILYLNTGTLPDGAVRGARLTYRMALKAGAGLLPKFTAIDTTQDSDVPGATFASSYGENRMRSLMHYWLALIETPARDAEPFREILAGGFKLNFSGGAIEDFAAFKAWYDGPAASVAAAAHVIKRFEVSEAGPGLYMVVAELDWNGIRPDGGEMIARTRHTWRVEDNPADRFARISTIDVELLVPFQPKPTP